MPSLSRNRIRNRRFLLTLVAAWSILLGAAHALHAVYHQSLPGAVSGVADQHCTLCALDRNPLLTTPEAVTAVSTPVPDLLPLPDSHITLEASFVSSRDALSLCAGRAPPSPSFDC